ncbi:MAG TPA: ABC transporter substrate-binding protein, partial [Gemmataceae bacterium]|nr:ABC transporter substrate-binding protein [Gemmataceae bacterium]
ACLAVPVLLGGCARRAGEPISLVLMSPHRDEIREEFDLGFRDWFRERSEARLAAARATLQTWLHQADVAAAAAVQRAFADLFYDWRKDDLPELATLYGAWQEKPSRESGTALLAGLDKWQQQLPPVQLVWQDIGGGTSQIARYVDARFQSHPEGIGIDFVFGGGTDIFLRFADQGRLESIEIPAAVLGKRIPQQINGIPLYDVKGRWYGPILSSFGILYNREVLKRIRQPEPRLWADLGEPGVCGWVSAGEPRMTGSVHMVYEIILQGRGWEKGFQLLMRLGANTHTFIRDSGTLTRTVSGGEDAAAGVLDGFALSAVGRDPLNMAFWLPEGETLVNPDASAVLKGAPHKELARAFMEYSLSDAGQKLLLLQPGQPGGPRRHALCRLSVVPELYAQFPPEVRSVGAANPFQLRNAIAYNSKLGNQRWDAVNDAIGAMIVDAHEDLAAAWKAVIKLPDTSPRRAEQEAILFAPICSEKELMTHARNIVEESPRVRTATVNRWGEIARQRYRAVRLAATR